MKLKKTESATGTATATTPAPGGVAIADRFKLETPEAAEPKKSGGALAAVSLVCTLAAIALAALTAWMMYMNWELIKGV